MTGLGSRKTDALVDWSGPINWLAPLNRGLVGWWMALPGTIGGRNLLDLCRRNDLTLTSMDPATAWKFRSGSAGIAQRQGNPHALYYDGAAHYVMHTTAPSLDLTPDLTITAWINPIASGSSIFRTIIAKRVGAAATTNYQLYLSNAVGANAGVIGYYNGVAVYQSSTVPAVLTWSHVAATVRATALTLYHNGAVVHTATLSGNPATNAGDFRIGWSGWVASTEQFYGYIDDVRMYNRQLSAFEMRSLYDAGRANYPAELRRVRSTPTWEPPPGSTDRIARRRAAAPNPGNPIPWYEW